MTLQVDQVNFWAVLVAAVATFMIGGAWYGAVFAKMWVAIHGFSKEELKVMEKKTPRNFAIFFCGRPPCSLRNVDLRDQSGNRHGRRRRPAWAGDLGGGECRRRFRAQRGV